MTASFEFLGYRRPRGGWGVRNHCLVLPTSEHLNRASELVDQAVPGAVCVTHFNASAAAPPELHLDVLAGICTHHNVGRVILLSVERSDGVTDELAGRVAAAGLPVDVLTLLDHGSMADVAGAASELARASVAELAATAREPAPLAELIVGTECGGSDAFSGLTANPALGHAMDLLVAQGGTAVLAEMTELLGAEHLLAERAATPEVAAQIVGAVLAWERMIKDLGENIRDAQPAPGNVEGGLTTIEEKSLGAATKGGTSPIVEVVGYGRRPTRRGLVIMDTPGNDVEQLTGMTAGGCQLVVFTTGRGTPTASPVAPTIKVSTNRRIAERMADHIDLDAGRIAAGEATKEEVGRELLEEIIAVASGKLTKAELFGQKDFALPRTLPAW